MDGEMIREGMTVYSAEGDKLGKVVRQDGDFLQIEKGLFFKRDYLASIEDIDRVEGDQAWLRRTREELDRAAEPGDGDLEDELPQTTQPRNSEPGLSAAAAPDDLVIVAREEVDVVVAADEGDGDPTRPPVRGTPDRDPDTRE